MFNLVEEFLALKTEEPKLFYIWGHTYELDATDDGWELFEKLCSMISNKEDIFYGTNGEVTIKFYHIQPGIASSI